MSTYALNRAVSIRALLLGRLPGARVVLFLLSDGASRLIPRPVVTGYGSSEALARALGLLSVVCTGLYTIPPTSIVGAILWTGYLGNIAAAHLPIV